MSIPEDQAWRTNLAWFGAEMSKGSGEPWHPFPWIAHFADVVQREIGKGGARIIANAPPRHGKSFLVSKWLPIFFLDLHPTKRVILSSYGDTLSGVWGRAVRNEFLFNDRLLSRVAKDSKSVMAWDLEDGGGMISVGVGSGVTGKGGHLIIVDDAHKSFEEAMSVGARTRVIDWFNHTLYTRKEPDASIIVIQTRWHEEDLTGYLLNDHADTWTHLNYPAIAEDGDILGRAPGEVLCPERWPLSVIRSIEKSLGSWSFAGQYQQRPAPAKGGMVKREWLKYHWQDPMPPMDEYIQSWDLTFKATGTSFVVGQVWGRKDGNFYLLDQVRGKWGFVEQVQAIQALSEKWPKAVVKIIEDTADAQAVKATLADSVPGIILVPARGSKEARLSSVLGLLEAGNVYLPAHASWLDPFIFELTTFPYSANDDQVDSMTQALKRISAHTYSFADLDLGVSDGIRGNPWGFANATAW